MWISYRVEGSGSPCLVMPATWGLDYQLYTSFLPLLEPQLQLIFTDPRGVAESGPVRSPEEFSAEVLLSDIEALRVALGYEKWIVFGHSGGGFVALKYAIVHPQRVSRLVLASTAASGRYFQQAIWQEEHIQNRFIRVARDTYREQPTIENFKRFLREIWKQSLFDPEKNVFLETYLRDSNINIERSKHFSNFERDQFDVTDQLRRVQVPTLVIGGKVDPQLPPKYTEELARLLPEARFVTFEESGHFPWIDEPAGFVRIVTDFLDSA